MSDRESTLFRKRDLRPTIENHFQKVVEKVDSIPEAQFLATDDDVLVEHVIADFRVVPLDLHEDAAQMEQEEVKVDVSRWARRGPLVSGGPHYVSGQRITVSIPFDGDSTLWMLKPSSWRGSFPSGRVRGMEGQPGGILDIILELPVDAPEQLFKQDLDRILADIRYYLGNQRADLQTLNERLPGLVRQAVRARRARLDKLGKVRQLLNLPLKKRPGAPDIEQIPIRRKLVKPLPPAPNAPAEPGIRDEDYGHILSVIRHEGRTFEATPATYAVHDEEELRDILLAHLNGHYQGEATGETFRGSGKTDIRIESDNRAAFVAECKVWRGAKEAVAAVDQLLGYLTWRDCKAALVLFNKDVAGFTAIQEKLGVELSQHELCDGAVSVKDAGEWRFRFRARQDPGRQIVVHVFLFNLFIASAARSVSSGK